MEPGGRCGILREGVSARTNCGQAEVSGKKHFGCLFRDESSCDEHSTLQPCSVSISAIQTPAVAQGVPVFPGDGRHRALAVLCSARSFAAQRGPGLS